MAETDRPATPVTPELADIIKRFLRYSFEDIRYQWADLTEGEQDLATEEEFSKLVEWIQS